MLPSVHLKRAWLGLPSHSFVLSQRPTWWTSRRRWRPSNRGWPHGRRRGRWDSSLGSGTWANAVPRPAASWSDAHTRRRAHAALVLKFLVLDQQSSTALCILCAASIRVVGGELLSADQFHKWLMSLAFLWRPASHLQVQRNARATRREELEEKPAPNKVSVCVCVSVCV
jgi:hypothetical protein